MNIGGDTMNREDFNMINENFIYLDNGATTLKPKVLLEPLIDYYTKYTANAHRGDYDTSLKVDNMFEGARDIVRDFIHAKSSKGVCFTSGTTDSLNKIIFGYCRPHLNAGDEVLITKSEHASNVLPWFELSDEKGIIVSYIPLDENLQVTMENVKKAITPKTKVISLAQVTNVVGDIRPIKEITKYAHERGILVIVDGAQSVPHMAVDVQDLDIDFLAFSGHKLCGPTGIGILYGKYEVLNEMKPIIVGGGMNAEFYHDGRRIYNDLPQRLDAGTPNIAGAIALGTAIKYIESIGFDKIRNHEIELRKYAIKRLKEIDDIIIYNEKSEGGIIAFNKKGIFAQDLAIYLNKYHICVRAGNHCAKILRDEIKIKNTCRISFYFYNTKEEIDKLIEVLKNPKIMEEIL